jgi:hypothetical protein
VNKRGIAGVTGEVSRKMNNDDAARPDKQVFFHFSVA